jgi:hypothetical protein
VIASTFSGSGKSFPSSTTCPKNFICFWPMTQFESLTARLHYFSIFKTCLSSLPCLAWVAPHTRMSSMYTMTPGIRFNASGTV